MSTTTATPDLSVAGSGVVLGTTLYSMTSEWAAGRYDLDCLFRVVADAGIGPGIEINGAQMLSSYPDVTPDFVRSWRDAFERYGFVPSAFGTNLDMGRYRSRDMTLDEEVEFLTRQLRTADELGYRILVIRGASAPLLERLLPLAERLDQRLAWELHAPLGPTSPQVQQILETYDRLGSDRLGITADLSSTMHSLSPSGIARLVKMGLDDVDIAELQRLWATDQTMNENHTAFVEHLRSRGIDPASLGPYARLVFNMHAHHPVSDWALIMPRILHVHAKFFGQPGEEDPATDIPAIVRTFLDAGYRGFFSSEWEGHAFTDLADGDPVGDVQRQHALIRRTIETRVAGGRS